MFFLPNPPAHPTITVLIEPSVYDTGLLNQQGEKITRAIPRDPVGFIWFPHTEKRSTPDEEI